MLETLFLNVVKMSLTASVVILVVMLARLFLKRAPKAISYALWAVVLFRLLCPVSVTSDLSVFGMMQPKMQIAEQVPAKSENAAPAVHQTQLQTQAHPEQKPLAEPAQKSGTNGYTPVLAGGWVLGVLILAGASFGNYIRVRKALVGAVRLEGNVYEADHIPSPFVLGALRPKIYLPSALDARERGYILLHEQCHIRRLDPLWKLLAFAALCLHWFNPLVWAAFVLAGRDMEMSCDEAVIRKIGPQIRPDYAQSILSLATGNRKIVGTLLAFGEGDPKGRIKNLARWKRPAVWAVLLAVILGLVLTVALGTNPDKKQDAGWKDGMTFELMPGEEAICPEQIHITQAETDVHLRLTCKPGALLMTAGLRDENGTEYTVSVRGESENEKLEKMQPGSYQLFLRSNPENADHPDVQEKTDKGTASGVLSYRLEQNGKPLGHEENSGPGTSAQNVTVTRADLGNGLELRLVMKEGRYYTVEEEKADISIGIYQENYRGSYALEVWKGKQKQSEQSLDDLLAATSDGQTLNFPPNFPIELADYDHDGNMDFSLGQPCGTVETNYLLYTVDGRGMLKKKPLHGDLVAEGSTLSIRFEGEPSGTILFQRYDPAVGDFAIHRAVLENGEYYVEDSVCAAGLEENSQSYIDELLNSLTISGSGEVTLTLPSQEALDVISRQADEGTFAKGKTELRVMVHSSAYQGEGVYDNRTLIDSTSVLSKLPGGMDGWTAGGSWQSQLDLTAGSFNGLVAYASLTAKSQSDGQEQMLASGTLELTPQDYQPDGNSDTIYYFGYGDSQITFDENDDAGTNLVLTFTSGEKSAVTMELPHNCELREKTGAGEDGEFPTYILWKSGKQAGQLKFYDLGTQQPQELKSVDTAKNQLPMQIFAGVALSNHAGYENYRVQRSSKTGAAATATFWWQDLQKDTELSAAEIPVENTPCILAYDWQKMPVFLELIAEQDAFTRQELTALAKSIRIEKIN